MLATKLNRLFMEHSDLLRLYEITAEDHRQSTQWQHERFAFFVKLIVAVVAATIVGIFEASTWYHFAFLSCGPIISALLAIFGRRSVLRSHDAILKAVTVRAKLDQQLGLTKPLAIPEGEQDMYWDGEPLITPRHIKSRKDHKSSDDFIRSGSTGGDRITVKWFFGTIITFSVLMLLSLLVLSVVQLT